MRKSRASHVKCDCGEKTHKCQHLQQTLDGHRESCCCNHGGRCTCSHKKEPTLDTVLESESDGECHPAKVKSSSARRRRADTAHSEPVLSFDEQGHHKPTHRHNKASRECGPYSLSRGHSMHSNSSSSSIGGNANRSMDNLLHGKTATKARAKDAAKSEQTSPSLGSGASFQQLNGNLPPLDLSNISYEYPNSFDMFDGLPGPDAPLYSAGLSVVSVDWGQYDGLEHLGSDGFAPSSYDQTQSFAGFDLGSTEPTLTSNSGDVSETEDYIPAFSEAQMEGFRQSAATNYLDMSQSQGALLTGSSGDALDFDQFKGAGAANKFLPNIGPLDDPVHGLPTFEEDPYWPMNSFADGLTESPDPVATAFWDAA